MYCEKFCVWYFISFCLRTIINMVFIQIFKHKVGSGPKGPDPTGSATLQRKSSEFDRVHNINRCVDIPDWSLLCSPKRSGCPFGGWHFLKIFLSWPKYFTGILDDTGSVLKGCVCHETAVCVWKSRPKGGRYAATNLWKGAILREKSWQFSSLCLGTT